MKFEEDNDQDALPIFAEAELMAKGSWSNSNKDPEQDYALLHISTMDASKVVTPSPIGSSSNVKDGIIVEGYPAGSRMATEGIIGSLVLQNFKNIFIVDAKAWPGNSVGALFDNNNNLLGVVTMAGVGEGLNDDQTYVLKIDHIKSQLNAKGFQF